MREELLAYLWKVQKFRRKNLKTTSGESIVIVKPGQENALAGPDFFNAHIQIENTLWVGNVELHVLASDWFRHHHQLNSSYDNVILHVVWDDDAPIFDKNQQPLPTLKLADYTPKNFVDNYIKWLAQENKWILCADELHKLPKLINKQFWERLYVERLMEKTALFQSWLALSQNNWEAVFFVALAKGFGLKQNGTAFAQMALSIPWKVILQNSDKPETLEAIFMGQAGLFNKSITNPYFLQQQSSYNYYSHKYSLEPISEPVSFFRLRPTNFPTLRLSQLANLIYQEPKLFTLLQQAKNLKELFKLLDAKSTSFWEMHYHFDSPAKKTTRKLTKSFKELLLINTVFPFLFQYYAYTGDKRKSSVLDWMRQLPAEKNKYITNFERLGCTIEDALESQACIQLKDTYCTSRRCLKCAFGHKLLNL